MAYVTGSAASFADLLTAIQTACTDNGWTLSGAVLHNGNCYTQVRVIDAVTLGVQGGTGIDGSNALTGAGPAEPLLCAPKLAAPLAFPITYFLHVYDHEVYCIVNWSLSAYAYLAFGCSPLAGLPGTGGWYSASMGNGSTGTLSWSSASDFFVGVMQPGNGFASVGPFWVVASAGIGANATSYVHHGLDGLGWSSNVGVGGANAAAYALAAGTAGPVLLAQPNAWNGESLLIPMQPYVSRPDGFMSIVADMEHARFINIANLDAESIITLGTDKWRVYPFYKKGATLAPGVADTGYLGFAVHYDGP